MDDMEKVDIENDHKTLRKGNMADSGSFVG